MNLPWTLQTNNKQKNTTMNDQFDPWADKNENENETTAAMSVTNGAMYGGRENLDDLQKLMDKFFK